MEKCDESERLHCQQPMTEVGRQGSFGHAAETKIPQSSSHYLITYLKRSQSSVPDITKHGHHGMGVFAQ